MTRLRTITAMGLVALITGCAASQQAREVESSGFLGPDYALLRSGQEGEALLTYRKAGTDWAGFDRIKLEPVTIWSGEASAFADFSAEDQQTLADTFYSAIHTELSQDYAMADELGPGVLRIQVALTEADASNPTMDTISSIVPQALLVSEAKNLITGKPSFVGEASAEARISDGASGETLAAAVDRRVGGKSLGGSTDSWNDVRQAFVYWARQFRFRLCSERGGTDCVAPTV